MSTKLIEFGVVLGWWRWVNGFLCQHQKLISAVLD